MPLPFTPAEAWHLLSPATQAEIGAAVLGMALADYVSGDMHDEADHFRDDTRDMRKANYYATRSLRTLMAVGRGPIPRTVSGVPAIPRMPVLCQ